VSARLRRALFGVGSSLILALLVWAVLPSAVGRAPAALINFGPHDQEYASGLRIDWERDGRTIFHWSEPSARVVFPLHLEGDARLVLRVRRHFTEPAQARLLVQGTRVAEFQLSANTVRDPQRPWAVMEFALPRLSGREPVVAELLVAPVGSRNLGLALDWVELRPTDGGRLAPTEGTRRRAALAALALGVLLLLARAGALHATLGALLLGLTELTVAAVDPMALERVLRLGLPTFVVGVSVAVVACRLAGWDRSVSSGSAAPAPFLVGLVAAALLVRLALLLHPEFYYPDVRVHALFARELYKLGPVDFMSTFTANQFRFSLGLQFEGGHWYAFPYPPLFYILTWPLIRWAGYAPETAVSLLPALVNALEALLVFSLGRQLLGRENSGVALAAAAAVPLLPIFVARLSMAYFPALVGHAIDLLLLLVLVTLWPRLDRMKAVLAVGGMLGLALLAYTQALLNFGLLLPIFLALQATYDRSPSARRRQVGLFLAGLIGLGVSMSFYARYIPVFAQMRQGAPMAGEEIVLERLAQSRFSAVADEADPFTGPGFELARGVRKAGWRLFVFYGWFAPLVVLGAASLIRRTQTGDLQRLVAVWAGIYLLLNFASGSLPGPNLFRYNKDLELVAPIACLALACVWGRVVKWSRAAAVGLALAYFAFFAWRATEYLLTQTYIDRLSGI